MNQVFGNKLAILGGDFLLSRASVSLARLRNYEVLFWNLFIVCDVVCEFSSELNLENEALFLCIFT